MFQRSRLYGADLMEPDDTIILAANALNGDMPARIIAREHAASKPPWFEGHDGAPSCNSV